MDFGHPDIMVQQVDLSDVLSFIAADELVAVDPHVQPLPVLWRHEVDVPERKQKVSTSNPPDASSKPRESGLRRLPQKHSNSRRRSALDFPNGTLVLRSSECSIDVRRREP